MAISETDSKPALRAQLGETVRLARVRRRWSQEDLATKAGVGTKQIIRLERDGNVLLSTAERVVDALGLLVNVSEAA